MLPVGLRAGRKQHLVVVLLQIGEREVRAELDVAEEAEARVRRDCVVGPGDGLDLRVIGRDAVAHQPVRRGQPVEHVDLDRRSSALLEEMLGGVERRGPGADDGDAQRLRGVPDNDHDRSPGERWLSSVWTVMSAP